MEELSITFILYLQDSFDIFPQFSNFFKFKNCIEFLNERKNSRAHPGIFSFILKDQYNFYI